MRRERKRVKEREKVRKRASKFGKPQRERETKSMTQKVGKKKV